MGASEGARGCYGWWAGIGMRTAVARLVYLLELPAFCKSLPGTIRFGSQGGCDLAFDFYSYVCLCTSVLTPRIVSFVPVVPIIIVQLSAVRASTAVDDTFSFYFMGIHFNFVFSGNFFYLFLF